MIDFDALESKIEGKQVSVQALTPDKAIQLIKGQFGQQTKDMQTKAKAIEVNSIESEKQAIEMAGQIKNLVKELEDNRKEIIKEQYNFISKVNSFCKVFKDTLEPMIKQLKDKIGAYQWSKELERRKKEKEAEEAQKALQKKIEEEAKKEGVEPPPPPPMPVEKKQTVTRADSGASAHIRTAWTFEITDESQIPREYLKVDDNKIKSAIEFGKREIPGLKIFEKPVTYLRS